jgi:iron complex outermembrane receptor protein
MTRRTALLATAALLGAAAARADDVGQVFSLGEVTVVAPRPQGLALGGSVIGQDEIRDFERNTLDSAIQLVPGATVSAVGARNETDVWIRGFDRWRLRLSQDGIPIYLPADNRVDFSQFTTGDIGEIQVSKGYTSVIDGPGAMAGAINLVSRQVSKPFEGDARVGTSFDNDGAFNGFHGDVFAGTRQDNWYVQGAASELYRNHFALSDDFKPGTYENGGNRDHSYQQDYKINVKAGYVPNATDEYSLNIIDQMGHKDNTLPDEYVPAASASSVKFWTWPAWDKQSIYWLSNTALDDRGSQVKVRLYGDRFYNALDSFDTAAFSTQKSPKSFDSEYEDYAAGGSIELSEAISAEDTLRAAFHYRWDQHNAWEATNAKAGGPWYSQPWLQDEENTYSGAIENIWHPARDWDVTAGVSYDYRQMMKAQDFNAYSPVPAAGPYGFVLNYPVSDNHAINPELAAVYHYDPAGSAHVSLTERTRFPTLFEMFSSRFGTVTGNPYLRPEKADTAEIGFDQGFGKLHVGANLYYSKVFNAIGTVPITLPVVGATTQSQNVGVERHQGFELEASWALLDSLDIGGNYAYLDRENLNHFAVPTDTPKHKLFLHADWRPIEGLSVIPSFEFDSKRWLQGAIVTSRYYRAGDFAMANIKLAYDITRAVAVEIGANNLFDENYLVEDGYHGAGRNYFTNVRVTF